MPLTKEQKMRQQKLLERSRKALLGPTNAAWIAGTKRLLDELSARKTAGGDLSCRFLMLFLEQLYQLRRSKGGECKFTDVMTCIKEASQYPDKDERGRRSEVAKTILEILEPERVGPLVMGKMPGVWPGQEGKKRANSCNKT